MVVRYFCAISSPLVVGHARKAIIILAATTAPPEAQHPSRCPRSRSSSTVPTMLLLGPSYLTLVAIYPRNLAREVANAAGARRKLVPKPTAGVSSASRVVRLCRGPPPLRGLHHCRHPLAPAK